MVVQQVKTHIYHTGDSISDNKSKQHKVIPSASLHIRAAGSNVHPQMIVSQYSMVILVLLLIYLEQDNTQWV